eukprot:TRINITY_DN2081_c0_g1_i2.p1 TRINITY_DN2081_c0_g1~~TRINITY_DN2081_c0_g1_i2.p1  ORF type:complete len:314 (+),score=40.24 TRINITY_DN2081_c0_g1_i2:106-1047(+)
MPSLVGSEMCIRDSLCTVLSSMFHPINNESTVSTDAQLAEEAVDSPSHVPYNQPQPPQFVQAVNAYPAAPAPPEYAYPQASHPLAPPMLTGQPVLGQPVMGQPMFGQPVMLPSSGMVPPGIMMPYSVVDQRFYQCQIEQMKFKNDTNCFLVVVGVYIALCILGFLANLGMLGFGSYELRECDGYKWILVMALVNGVGHIFSLFLIYTGVRSLNDVRLRKGRLYYFGAFLWGIITLCAEPIALKGCFPWDSVGPNPFALVINIVLFAYVYNSSKKAETRIQALHKLRNELGGVQPPPIQSYGSQVTGNTHCPFK